MHLFVRLAHHPAFIRLCRPALDDWRHDDRQGQIGNWKLPLPTWIAKTAAPNLPRRFTSKPAQPRLSPFRPKFKKTAAIPFQTASATNRATTCCSTPTSHLPPTTESAWPEASNGWAGSPTGRQTGILRKHIHLRPFRRRFRLHPNHGFKPIRAFQRFRAKQFRTEIWRTAYILSRFWFSTVQPLAAMVKERGWLWLSNIIRTAADATMITDLSANEKRYLSAMPPWQNCPAPHSVQQIPLIRF